MVVMHRHLKAFTAGTALALTCAVAAIAPPPAAAFDTGPHTDITTEALRDEGFGTPAANVAGVNNYWVDLYSQAGETPYSGHASWYKELLGGAYFDREHWSQDVMDAAGESHFDNQRVRPLTDTASIEREWLHLRRLAHAQLQRAKAHNDPLEVLTVIGQTLHPVQDFYTHTNWIEPAGANDSPGWAGKGQGSAPTWFDVPKQLRDAPGVRIFPGSVPGDGRDHGHWQQDGNLNLNTATAKDWPGRPLYNEAYMSSYFASRTWVQALRTYLGDDALWNRARAYAQNLSALKFDLWGAYNVPAYVGHWSGEGGVCKYVVTCGGPEAGAGGSLVGARWATNKYFEDRPGGTIFRKTFYRLITGMGEDNPPAVPESQLAVPSSRSIQDQTQFVRLRMMKIGGLDLSDPLTDDADLYGRATIDGHDFISAMIQGHDTFSFPRPYAPFTWLKPVSRGSFRGLPVETITVRIKTSSSTWSGTDDNVYLRTSTGQRFQLDKSLYDDFERGDDDTYSVPIDQIARQGFTLGDIQMLQIEKSPDGAAGGWKLQSFSVSVNGGQIYASGNINKWLEKNTRTYRANYTPRTTQTTGVPVWMDLMEDDIVYGDDDQGDVNRLDARNAVVRTYVPGSPAITESLRGDKQFGGRLNKGGDFTKLTYTIDTVNPKLWTPPRQTPGDLGNLPVIEAQPEPDPKPTTPTPTTPTPTTPGPTTPAETGKPDLVITEFGLTTLTVKNQGTATAGASTVRVSPSTNVAIPSLAPGASATRTWREGGCPEGNWTATADFLGQVNESNESNNGKSLEVIC